MSEQKHTPGPRRESVEVDGRTYTVNFDDAGKVASVHSHVIGRGGHCKALRFLSLTGPSARAAIAKATGAHP